MAVRTRQRKKQQLLISVLGLVVIVTVGVLFLGRGGAPEVPPPPVTGGQIIPRVPIPNELFIDRSFQGLVPYDPVTLPENIGKNNPFKP